MCSLKAKSVILYAACCITMHMDKPVMKDTGATPTCGHLRDNASHVLLGRVYWQGWKAVWVGRKYFTSNIRSSGTEQTVCDCMCRSQWVCVGHVLAKTRKLLCERVSVWDMCGRVCVCLCVWVSSIPIHQSHPWAALCLRRKMNHAQRTRPAAALLLLPPFPPDSP